jgi:hypothetical protein
MRRPPNFLSVTLFVLTSGSALAQNVPPSAIGNWIISETSSPVDYSPVVIAVTRPKDDVENPAIELSIYCRNGQTNLVVTGSTISGHGDAYTISYRINRDKPVEAGTGSPSFGSGVAFRGDVVRLLQSFPDEGEITIRLTTRTGAAREASFSLDGLSSVRSKVASACKWPKPGN